MKEKFIRSPFGELPCYEDPNCPFDSSRGRSKSHESRLCFTEKIQEAESNPQENQ